MKFHIHDYKRIGKPQHLKWDYDGIEVIEALCKCSICGKEKYRKFIGHIIGQWM